MMFLKLIKEYVNSEILDFFFSWIEGKRHAREYSKKLTKVRCNMNTMKYIFWEGTWQTEQAGLAYVEACGGNSLRTVCRNFEARVLIHGSPLNPTCDLPQLRHLLENSPTYQQLVVSQVVD